jgi:integrase/recombinase XerD
MLSDVFGRGLAERQGFEPWIPCGIHAFQACAFSHSAISPIFSDLAGTALRKGSRLGEFPMTRFVEFTRERQYLHNVSPATISWYAHALKWLPSESPTQDDLKAVVLRMREAGLKETGCNAALRAINAYLHWNSGAERKCGAGCNHPRIGQLREPQNILPTLTESQVKLIVGWKLGKNCYRRRWHLLALVLLDTGCRITEALTLRVSDIDLDNLLLVLNGKGSKQRVVPFSFVLRKALHRHITECQLKPESLLFATKEGTAVWRITALRSIKLVCKQLGFAPPARTLHSFGHTFAIFYLRRGGSVFHLQKIMGHSSLEMTKRYAALSTADLQAVHERVSLLSK